MIEIGTAVPEMVLEGSGGEAVKLSDYAAKGKKLVLFFYPKDSTSG
jgi:peroxiredoxin Q/BCP